MKYIIIKNKIIEFNVSKKLNQIIKLNITNINLFFQNHITLDFNYFLIKSPALNLNLKINEDKRL